MVCQILATRYRVPSVAHAHGKKGASWEYAQEIFEVQRKKSAEDQLPSFWWQQWAFFFTTAFYLYGRYIRRNLMVEVVALNSDWVLTRLIKIALKYHALM